MSLAQPAMAAYGVGKKSRKKRPSGSALPTGGSRGAARKTAGNLGAAASGGRGIRSTYQSPRPPRPKGQVNRQRRDADLDKRMGAAYKKAESGGAFKRVAQGTSVPRRETSPVSAGRGFGASGVKQARKSAMASSAAARKQLHKTSRTLSQTARKRDMAEASPRAKKEMAAAQQSRANDRKATASRARKKPPAGARTGARTEAYKKAPPAQSARMADQKAYARAAEGFAKKRAAPASPARKKRANQSGGTPSPRQGGYKKAAQAMRAGVKKRTRATNQRRASAAKVAGRGVRGPGLGRGRR